MKKSRNILLSVILLLTISGICLADDGETEIGNFDGTTGIGNYTQPNQPTNNGGDYLKNLLNFLLT